MFGDIVAWHEFCRVLQRSRRWTRHDNDRKSVLHLWHHQVQWSQDDPVLWWTEPKASSLSTESGDICFLWAGHTNLIGKLSEADLIALGAKYHLDCVGHFHWQAATNDKKYVDSSKTSVHKAQAFSDLVECIESFRGSHMSLPMSDMVELYESRLISLGIDS